MRLCHVRCSPSPGGASGSATSSNFSGFCRPGTCCPAKLLDNVACENGNWYRRNLYFQSSRRCSQCFFKKKGQKLCSFCQIMPKNLLAQSIRTQHSEMMELALDTPRSRRVTAWIRVIRPSDQGASAGRLMPRCWAGSRPSCGLGTTPWRRKGRGTRERAGTAGARRHPMHLSVSGRTHDDGDRRQRHWCGGCCSLSGRP